LQALPCPSRVRNARCPKLNRCKAQFGPKTAFPFPQSGVRDALGRRAAEGVPDSQSASERGERAEGPESPREQGWRHLVVN